MAYATGTATDHNDLFTKLIAFLKTNAALVAAGEQWATAWQDSDSSDIVLRGPGLAAQDQVYVGFHQNSNVVGDKYWIELVGLSGVVPTGTTFTEHINPSPRVRMFLDNNPMTYWFVASGRRFVCVVKISTIFQACYGGLFLPYATPLSYGYPMFIGGSTGQVIGHQFDSLDWRSTLDTHRHFVEPHYNSSQTFMPPSAYMMDPAGQWLYVAAVGNDANVAPYPAYGFTVFGRSNFDPQTYTLGFIRARTRDAFGGQYILNPITLVQQTPTDQSYGVLEGCYRVQGFDNSSENIITVDGVNYLTVQNVFRVGIGDYWALRLE